MITPTQTRLVSYYNSLNKRTSLVHRQYHRSCTKYLLKTSTVVAIVHAAPPRPRKYQAFPTPPPPASPAVLLSSVVAVCQPPAHAHHAHSPSRQFSPGICQIFPTAPHPHHRIMAPKIQSKIRTGQSNHAHAKIWSARILTYGFMHMINRAPLFIVDNCVLCSRSM